MTDIDMSHPIYCPQCETKCSANDAICLNCGHVLAGVKDLDFDDVKEEYEQAAIVASIPPMARPANPIHRERRSCPKCLELVHVKALKCPYCRSNIRTSPTTIVVASMFALFCLFACTGGFGMIGDGSSNRRSHSEIWRDLGQPVGSSSTSRTSTPMGEMTGYDWDRLSYNEKLAYGRTMSAKTNYKDATWFVEAVDTFYTDPRNRKEPVSFIAAGVAVMGQSLEGR